MRRWPEKAKVCCKKVNWVIDLDIRSFFDRIDHSWMIKFVEHRIGDRRIVRLIQKWLKAGVLEQGQWNDTKEGSPQGAMISPPLANLYLHYVLDLWVEAWRKKQARGDVIIVRYADRDRRDRLATFVICPAILGSDS